MYATIMDGLAVVQLLLSVTILTSAFPVLAAFVQNIHLDHNGNITNEWQLPACTDGKIIELLSYKFCRDANHCEGTNMGKASPAEEELIHRMCSLKKNCTDPGKPLKKGFGVLTVSYDCLGLYEGFVAMCENNTFANRKLIRLRYDGNETSYEKCQCDITGDFNLTLEDVRLRRMNSDLCSPAKLQVNSRVYECADGMEARGAVFHKQINNLKKAHVVFTSNSQMVKPEMIYWTLKPEVNNVLTPVYVTCQNIPIKIVSTTTEIVETTDVTESDDPFTGAGTTTSSVSGSVGMVAVGSGATLLIVLVCIAVWLIRRNREKKRRIEHLENLIANRNKQQCVHPEEFQNSMVYSLARDDKINKDDGDYVGLLHCPNLRQEKTDDCGDNQTREDETDTAFADGQCGTDYDGSKSNRKWWRKKSPKQNTAVYSYATQESLLRGTSGAEGSCEREAASVTDSGTTKQSLTASNTKPDNYYFKLLPIEESTKCTLDVGATEPHFKSDNKKSRKKQIQNKKTNNQTEDRLAEGYNLGLQYIEDHYAFPKVDVTEQSKAMPISDNNKTDNKHEDEQSANRYETIDINYSLDSQCQDKPKSTGIFKTIVNIIFKPSNQNANTAHKDENERSLQCHNEGSVLRLDAVDISFESKRRDAQVAAQNLGVDQYDSTTFHKKMDSVDPKYDHLCSQKTPMSSHLQRKTDKTAKRTWSPSEKEFGKKSITSQPTEHGIGKDKTRHIGPGSADNSDDRDSDDDHYDKFTVDQKFQQKHPNYDKVSKAMNTTFKSLFRKHSAKMDI